MRGGPRGVRRVAGVVLAGTLIPSARLPAQDIEAVSALTGIPLPAAYYEEIRRDPRAFELPHGLFWSTPEGPVPAPPVEGTARLPVILALFADSREPHLRPEDVGAALFEGPASAGTITAYYDEISRGRFRVEGDVFPWVRTDVTMAQVVGDSYGLGGTARLGEYLLQALAVVDEHVDFSRYDTTGDGFVDAVAFEFLEVAASCGGPSIWPHRSSIASRNHGEPYVTDDVGPGGTPVKVNGYIIQGVTDCSGVAVQTAATIAHEFGHVLGLPDFYHPVGGIEPEHRRWVLGCWELMAAGAWGCGPVAERLPFGPTHMMAPQKELLGWAETEVAGEVWDQEFVLEPVQQSGRALVVPLDSAGTESLVLEYRPRVGFDHPLPAEGVLITHRDLAGTLRPTSGFRYRVRLLEADGNDGLVRTQAQGGNRGEAGDAFGVDGVPGRLNALTRPPLLRNADGRPSTVAIHSIAVADGRARVRLSTGGTPRVIVADGVSGSVARPLQGSARIAGGLMPYAVLGVSGAPEGVGATAIEDRLMIHGTPWDVGPFELRVHVGDARGGAVEALVPVSVREFFVTHARLLQPFLGTDEEPLLPGERSLLDALGNANGVLDVGDVRAWLLREQGSGPGT